MSQLTPFQHICYMRQKLKLSLPAQPQDISNDEFDFVIKSLREEIEELIKARASSDLEKQFDAYLDILAFAYKACAEHGFNADLGMHRVVHANSFKEVVKSADESKRGYKYDLKKPAGWREPILTDLVYPQVEGAPVGLVLLEGPDGAGKTTLAEHLVKHYGAIYIHSTWSPELELRMEDYMLQTLEMAKSVSQKRLVVLDRHFLSEIVYSAVFRADTTPDRSAFHAQMYHTFFAPTPFAKSLLVMCLPEDKLQWSASFEQLKTEREEMYANVDKAYDGFAALWEKTLAPDFAFTTNFPADLHDVCDGFSGHSQTVHYDWTRHIGEDDLSIFCAQDINNMLAMETNDECH